MDYDFKINGRETEAYKCYSDDNNWIATIRHYDDAEAIEKLLKQYGDKILTITKSDKIICKTTR